MTGAWRADGPRAAAFGSEGVATVYMGLSHCVEHTNWTNEDTLNDNLGDGTFVAGVIVGRDAVSWFAALFEKVFWATVYYVMK
nr:subtilisin-like protease sbt6.1 [Quercus suber]